MNNDLRDVILHALFTACPTPAHPPCSATFSLTGEGKAQRMEATCSPTHENFCGSLQICGVPGD